MARIMVAGAEIEVDAGLIADGFGVPVSQLKELMQSDAVTSRCERGVEEDGGRYRLTFFHKSCRLQLIIDSEGRLLRRTSIDFGDRPLPSTLRRPSKLAPPKSASPNSGIANTSFKRHGE